MNKAYADALADGTSAVTRDIEAAWDSTMAGPDEVDAALAAMRQVVALRGNPALLAAIEKRLAENTKAVAETKKGADRG